MAELPLSTPLPVPETDDLGRYLEDTITIDWQTPSVTDLARRLLAEARAEAEESDLASARRQIERLFRFVRDEIVHSFDLSEADHARLAERDIPGFAPGFARRGVAGRASEVLALGHGLCFAKSHLLAALLRQAGHPTGFCHVRLVDDERPGRFVLHGFVACLWPATGGWILLDPRGNRGRPGEPGAIESECRFAPPYSLAFVPDPARGEALLPFIAKRPGRRIVDLLERVPDRAALARSLPDTLV